MQKYIDLLKKTITETSRGMIREPMGILASSLHRALFPGKPVLFRLPVGLGFLADQRDDGPD